MTMKIRDLTEFDPNKEKHEMKDTSFNILIGGEAGQGLITVGQILSRILVRSGYFIVVTQSYHSRIRGGHNTFAIRVGNREIAAPGESVDILVALNKETVSIHRKELSPGGIIILDEALEVEGDALLKVPFKKLAHDRFSNVVALGVAGCLLGMKEKFMLSALDDFFGKKHADLVAKNHEALSAAVEWTARHGISSYRLPTIKNPDHRLMMNGNEAIALGAVSAGLQFYSFYPMTPATSIGLNLAAHATKMGFVVEQAEDEISAINMAIGASFAGAPSMVATSGGGFALMVEGVSLAAMTETPVVVVVAQRPGPATGLPTRTEQGDLELVLHSGHGEFPRALFAPGTIEECFHLTRKAFELAERYQGPMFLLTDQFLADSYRAVVPFDIKNLPTVHSGTKNMKSPHYTRYSITESGISPRLLPGLTENLIIADSDEHTEDGHITEDLLIRKQMVKKRIRKGKWIFSEVTPPLMEGEEKPDLLLVSWGSSKGAVNEAARHIRSKEGKVATLHFSQVWPLVEEHFMHFLTSAREVVCIEGNAFGQLARLIRRETGLHIERTVLRYDGLPITPEFILRNLGQ